MQHAGSRRPARRWTTIVTSDSVEIPVRDRHLGKHASTEHGCSSDNSPSRSGLERGSIPGTNASLLIAALLLTLFSGCGTKSPAPAPVTQQKPNVPSDEAAWIPPGDLGYVGSKTCATCHAKIAETFQTHPMANSIKNVDEVVPHDNELTRRVDGISRFYEVSYAEDGKLFHHEKMLDVDQNLIFDQALQMHFVVGSGRRAHAYLHQQGELLFQSPLNWYSEAEKWDLSPGYVKDDTRRFRRRVTDECLACHAGRVATSGRSLNRYRSTVFEEMSIGCENCHGAGGHHVALHESGKLVERVDDPIVNPSRLPHTERESVCNQCHLQATARVLRPGRSHFDFRPGMNLESIWTVLDAGVDIAKDGQTRAVNHVQQMRASRCYVASQGQLGCISCHNPHQVPSPAEKDAFYRSRCYTCHNKDDCTESQDARELHSDACRICHMPDKSSNNVSHVTQSDHRIMRRHETLETTSSPSEEVRLEFFDGANKRLTDWESSRALATAIWFYLDKKGSPAPASFPELLKPVLKAAPNDENALTLMGAFFRQRNARAAARDYFERAKTNPASEETAVGSLLTLNYLDSRWAAALLCADRMIELDPQGARFHSLRADILQQSGRPEEGIAAAQQALQLDPTLMPVREWLVQALANANRITEQHTEQRLRDRMQAVIDAAGKNKDVPGKSRQTP